jgi:hypothetical protein
MVSIVKFSAKNTCQSSFASKYSNNSYQSSGGSSSSDNGDMSDILQKDDLNVMIFSRHRLISGFFQLETFTPVVSA